MKTFKILLLIILFPSFLWTQNDSIYNSTVKFMDDNVKNNDYHWDILIKKDNVFLENILKYANTYKTDSNYYKTKKIVEVLLFFSFNADTATLKHIKYKNYKSYKKKRNQQFKLRQQAVNYILDICNYPGIRCSFQDIDRSNISDFSAEDFNHEAKQKISKLLNGYISQDDYNRHKAVKRKELLKNYNSYLDNYSWQQRIKKIIKKTNKSEKHIRDSICTIWLQRDLPKFKLKRCYHTDLLYTIGKNYMYEFVPQIKTLMDTAKGFPVYFSKLVLARMGEEPYLTEMLDTLEKFEYIPTCTYESYKAYAEQVAFICHNPRSINIFKKWMDTKYLYQSAPISYSTTSDNHIKNKYNITIPKDTIVKPLFGSFYPANIWAAYELANLVYDFPQKYKTFPNRQYYYDVVNYTKKWFYKNQENIRLNNLSYFETYSNLSVLYVNVNSKSFKEQYKKELERAKKELNSRK